MLEKLEICRDFFHGFDYRDFLKGNRYERVRVLGRAVNFVYGKEDGRDRIVPAVSPRPEQPFALAVPKRCRDPVSATRSLLPDGRRGDVAKSSVTTGGRAQADVETAIRQLVSKALIAEGVIDVFEVAGLKKPDISVLSEEFLDDLRGAEHKNLAAELLRKLLHDELKTRRRKNVVQAEAFSEKLERTITRYHNRAIATVQVIEELIAMAREMNAADQRGEELGLSDDELAFYDALELKDRSRCSVTTCFVASRANSSSLSAITSRSVIEEAVEKLKAGTISSYRYDPETAQIVSA